jgi:hypothetical protein
MAFCPPVSRAALGLGKETHILDGDNRLICKDVEQVDLPVAERAGRLSCGTDGADG